MEGKVKVVLQVLFIAALIWLLGAMSGKLPGATLRIGRGKGKHCRQNWPKRRFNPNTWVVSGMTGGEMIASPGSNVPAVGRPVWP